MSIGRTIEKVSAFLVLGLNARFPVPQTVHCRKQEGCRPGDHQKPVQCLDTGEKSQMPGRDDISDPERCVHDGRETQIVEQVCHVGSLKATDPEPRPRNPEAACEEPDLE